MKYKDFLHRPLLGEISLTLLSLVAEVHSESGEVAEPQRIRDERIRGLADSVYLNRPTAGKRSISPLLSMPLKRLSCCTSLSLLISSIE
jgi:hypothetical protein